jgi:cation/acetate symporter
MIYDYSLTAAIVFGLFVGFTLALSFYFARRTHSAQGYFAAGGQIHWFVNGIAFAGDYLSAASFLGICGMIAFYGYDGFLYSIGYLAGWIVALFVVAEPLKRMGKYTFADALNSRFQSRAITLSAGISTLAVSVFYLIPQMVGAGVLVQPLLGFSHDTGVIMVGTVVVLIVVTAGMVSTTYVQFLKGSLLVIFCAILTVMILNRGLTTQPGGEKFRPPRVSAEFADDAEPTAADFGSASSELLPDDGPWKNKPYVRLRDSETGILSIWRQTPAGPGHVVYWETQTLVETTDGKKLVNGLPRGTKPGENDFYPVGNISRLPNGATTTGPLGPLEFFSVLEKSEVITWGKDIVATADGTKTTVYYPQPTSGSVLLQPGGSPTFKGLRGDALLPKLNFLSLMLALFCGTASLPHILIRYYTVKDQAAARKSTVVGIASIGFFYVLTFFLGLGAMTSGTLDVTNNNMSAPLLAKSFGELIFAMISAIAFTTVLGTVSGLIVAASGAVVHDLLVSVCRIELNDHQKVRLGRFAALGVGILAIWLGIRFEKMNPSFLVGWAFSVAASANLPSLVMLLFWRGTTKQGIATGIFVGMISSLAWILLSGDTYKDVYGLPPETALVPFSQPGIVTIPLGFLTVIVVSLLTRGTPPASLDKR